MTDDTVTDVEDVTANIVTAATGSIVRVFEYLANQFGDSYDDDVALNSVFVTILSDLLGDMLAHFPDGKKDQFIKMAHDRMIYSQLMTETELAETPQEQEVSIQKVGEIDLAKIKPLGNA